MSMYLPQYVCDHVRHFFKVNNHFTQWLYCYYSRNLLTILFSIITALQLRMRDDMADRPTELISTKVGGWWGFSADKQETLC